MLLTKRVKKTKFSRKIADSAASDVKGNKLYIRLIASRHFIFMLVFQHNCKGIHMYIAVAITYKVF